MYKILDTVNEPKDLKKLNYEQLIQLADEVRMFLIKSVSETGVILLLILELLT